MAGGKIAALRSGRFIGDAGVANPAETWEELTADHTTGGSFGEAVTAGGTNSDAILADTNELQGDWENGGRLDNLLDDVIVDIAEINVNDIVAKCTSDTPSTTAIFSTMLTGYGDDFFNDDYYLLVYENANAQGDAPEGEVKLINDYDSDTGEFTTEAFSQNVEEDDKLAVMHKMFVTGGTALTSDITDAHATTDALIGGIGGAITCARVTGELIANNTYTFPDGYVITAVYIDSNIEVQMRDQNNNFQDISMDTTGLIWSGALACDGASVLLKENSGVATREFSYMYWTIS